MPVTYPYCYSSLFYQMSSSDMSIYIIYIKVVKRNSSIKNNLIFILFKFVVFNLKIKQDEERFYLLKIAKMHGIEFICQACVGWGMEQQLFFGKSYVCKLCHVIKICDVMFSILLLLQNLVLLNWMCFNNGKIMYILYT